MNYNFEPLEKRILFDAAVAAVVGEAISSEGEATVVESVSIDVYHSQARAWFFANGDNLCSICSEQRLVSRPN